MTTDGERQALLETDPAAFARDLLASLGLPAAPLAAAGGWSNHVWLAPEQIVRLSSSRFRDSFALERDVIGLLPAAVPHAPVVAYGRVGDREWLVLARVPGRPLAEVWSHLDTTERRSAIVQLGEILRALHGVELPPDFSNPWLEDALAPGGRPRDAYHAPPGRHEPLLAAAYDAPGADRGLVDAVGAFIADRLDAFAGDRAALVHADVHFANLLWADGRITALLDFETARPAAPDLELDTLLRFVREPELYRGRDTRPWPARRDLAGVPGWLAGAYPALFAHPRLPARLAVYEALAQLVQVLNFRVGARPHDPPGHLKALLAAGDAWAAW